MKRRIGRAIALLASLGVVGLVTLFAALWLEHRTQLTLPTPTGSYPVGRALYDWKDDTTTDVLAPQPGTKRELLAWVWFPAAEAQSGAITDGYVPASVRPPAGTPAAPALFRLMTHDLSDLSKVHSHSLRAAGISPRQNSYPIAIVRAGASLEVATYSTLAEDLASHGYIVVGIDAPYRTRQVVFPDGRVMLRTADNNLQLVSGDDFIRRGNKLLAAWTSDSGFVLDRLDRLNVSDPSGPVHPPARFVARGRFRAFFRRRPNRSVLRGGSPLQGGNRYRRRSPGHRC